MAWIKERPNAYPKNFLPPHTDQFYATDIPMYYDDKHRFNINRALSKEDILKEHVSYPYLDESEVTFADIPNRFTRAHYDPNINKSVLNLKNIDPQNITAEDLATIGHETIHKTLNPKHGIEAASKLLEGSIEPYGGEYSLSRSASGEYEGAKRANTFHEDPYKNEHLLLYAIENLALPESDDDSLYQDFDRYDTEFADQISDRGIGYSLPALGKYGYRQYYEPKWASGFNAPGEVRRGIMGLQDSFRHAALKYKDILKKYGNRGRLGPRAPLRQDLDEGLGDASIAERIASQDPANAFTLSAGRKRDAAIRDAVNKQIGTSRGADQILPQQKPKPYVAPPGPHRDEGRGRRGSMPTGTAEKNPWGRADGGLMDIPLTGRSRYI